MKYTEEFVKQAFNNSKRISDFCRNLGIKPTGGNYRIAKNLITKFNLDITKLKREPWNKGHKVTQPHYTLESLLVKNSLHKGTTSLKNRLIKEGIKEQKCEICGYTENLELHHINGDPTDNRLENLQILCPNCHAKTNNFRFKGKGRTHEAPITYILTEEAAEQRRLDKLEKRRVPEEQRKVKRLVSKTCPNCGEEFVPKDSKQIYCSPECYHSRHDNRPDIITLIKVFKEKGNFTQTGNYFNVSDNAVRKWCILYGLPIKTLELKSYLDNIIIKEI